MIPVPDHNKIMYEILYYWIGAILWSAYDQPGRKMLDVKYLATGGKR